MSKFVLSAFADEAGVTLEEQIAALQRNNIRHMEIRSVNGKNICMTPLETVAEYKKKLDTSGIKVMTIGSPVGKLELTEDYNAHLAMFLHTLAVARILGATRIRMFSFFMPAGEDPAAHKELVMHRLQEMIDIAAGTGITLYHENEKDIYGDVDGRVLELMDAFEGKIAFIFDPANFIQCGCDPLEIYLKMKNHIGYFHMKDALADTGAVVPVGEGNGGIPQILADYAKDHDNTMLTIEPHLKTFAGLTDVVSMPSGGEFVYKDNNEAFDTAVAALKTILDQAGLSYE